jgi:hypothetical protein
MRTIIFDIEVSPEVTLTYPPHHDMKYLAVVEYQYLYCFSYKVLGEKKVYSHALPDYKLFNKEPHNDRELTKELYKVLSDCDQVICHNVSFDVPMSKSRFIYHGLPPIKPIHGICTLQMARKVAKFPANSLKELALFLGIKKKMDTSKGLGETLYRDPYNMMKWKEMRLYNNIDSEVTEEAFDILCGWRGKSSAPHHDGMCKSCGSNNYQLRGKNLSKQGGMRAICKDCLIWFVVK